MKTDKIVRLNRDTVYSCKISLKGVYPPIWRRFQVEPQIKLPLFHLALQRIMGWNNSELHFFYDNEGIRYGVPNSDPFFPVCDYYNIRLSELIEVVPQRLHYEYNAINLCEHELIIEKIVKRNPKCVYPVVLEGKKPCPYELFASPFEIGMNGNDYDGVDAPLLYDVKKKKLTKNLDNKRLFSIDEVNKMLNLPNFGF